MPDAMAPGAPSAPPGGGGDPMAAMAGGQKMPGAMAGGPAGPGATPALSPGLGAGNEAAADGLVKAIIPGLHKALSAYPIGGKKYTAVVRAITALTANFGKENQQSIVPSAILQMAQAAKQGAPMPGQTPPGIAPVAPEGAGVGAPPPPPM